MNILYIAHEYYDRRIRYGRELRKLGHKVTIIRLSNKRKAHQVSKHVLTGRDLVLLFSPAYLKGPIDSGFTQAARSRRVPIACYSTLSPSTPFSEWKRHFKHITFPFITNKEVVSWLREGGIPAQYRPFGYYADVYKPIEGLKKEYPVTFMGRTHDIVPKELDMRAKALNTLIEADVPIRIWGRDRQKRIRANTIGYSTHARQNKVYNMTKVNLDLPWVNSTEPVYANLIHMKNRFMEVPGSGGFLLTYRYPEFEGLLEDGKHCVYYDNLDDMVDKVRYYIKHDEERERIAAKGHKKVKTHFQFKHILRSMIKEIQKLTRKRCGRCISCT